MTSGPAHEVMPPTAAAGWAAPVARTPVIGTVEVPTSKSLTNRYLALAALATQPSTIRKPLVSRDGLLMLHAMEALGVEVERSPDDSVWRLAPPAHFRSGGTVDCGLAGTVMRFVPGLACLAEGPVHFDGDPAARTRPLAPLLTSLRSMGVSIDADSGDTLPLTVHGRGSLQGGTVEVDASSSSQFLSALLLLGPACQTGLTVRHTGERLPSLPHIAMTEQVLHAAGIDVVRQSDHEWYVPAMSLPGLDVTVEPDLSSAAAPLAAAAATGGSVTIPGWPNQTSQAGDAIRDVLERMGAQVAHTDSGLTVTGPGRPGQPGLRGLDINLHDVGELTPVIAALAALAQTPSRLTGIGHLRGHETDRLAALEAELTKVGCTVHQSEDGLAITPPPSDGLQGAALHSYADHRIAMAAAVLGTAVKGVTVDDIDTTSKTYPGFAHMWEGLVGA